jgi:hypothetical protein
VTNDEGLMTEAGKVTDHGRRMWIFWKNGHRGAWAQDKADRPAHAKRMISLKTMFWTYLSRTIFISFEFFRKGKIYFAILSRNYLAKSLLQACSYVIQN